MKTFFIIFLIFFLSGCGLLGIRLFEPNTHYETEISSGSGLSAEQLSLLMQFKAMQDAEWQAMQSSNPQPVILIPTPR